MFHRIQWANDIKMDQSGRQENLHQIQNPIQDNCNRPTYLTTYQQFLSRQQQPNQQKEKNRKAQVSDQQPNKIVLLGNGSVQKLQTPSLDSKQPESVSKQSESVNGASTIKNINSEKIMNYESNSFVEGVSSSLANTLKSPVKRGRCRNPNRNKKRNRRDTTSSDDSPASDMDSIISNEAPVELQDEPVMAYECTICLFETIYEDVFKDHMLTHKKKDTFHRCPKCDFRMKCRASVRMHMAIEDDQVEYCGLYSYSAECKGELAKHLRAHGKVH